MSDAFIFHTNWFSHAILLIWTLFTSDSFHTIRLPSRIILFKLFAYFHVILSTWMKLFNIQFSLFYVRISFSFSNDQIFTPDFLMIHLRHFWHDSFTFTRNSFHTNNWVSHITLFKRITYFYMWFFFAFIWSRPFDLFSH